MPTLIRYLFALLIGAVAALVVLWGHDLTFYRLIELVIALIVGGFVLALLDEGIRKAMRED
jgi:hypothetical protein